MTLKITVLIGRIGCQTILNIQGVMLPTSVSDVCHIYILCQKINTLQNSHKNLFYHIVIPLVSYFLENT